jgi:hypothetical protein
LRWEEKQRRSKLIGTLQQYPTKGAAWRAVQSFVPSVLKPISHEAETVKALAARYEAERFPTRRDTKLMRHSDIRTMMNDVSGALESGGPGTPEGLTDRKRIAGTCNLLKEWLLR